MRRWIILGIAAFMLGLLLACGTPRAVAPTIAPAVLAATTAPTAEPATDAPTTIALLPSGGLGLPRAHWEAKHGAGTANPAMGLNYNGKQYLVVYQADPTGVETAWDIEQSFPDNPSIDDARHLSERLLPDDRKLTKTYTTSADQLVDLYHSEWLKGRFPEQMKAGKLELPMWVNGEPGDFIVIYRRNIDTPKNATSIVIGIGNNP